MLFLNYIFIAEQNDQKIDVSSNNGKEYECHEKLHDNFLRLNWMMISMHYCK